MSGAVTVADSAAAAHVVVEADEPDAIIASTPPADTDAAFADARRAVDEASARRAAETRANLAEGRAQNAERAAIEGRRAAVAGALEAARAEVERHRIAKRAAREAGDFDAEEQADEALAGARYRLSSAQVELAQMGTAPAAAPASDGRGAVSASTQQWIDAHADQWGNAPFRDAMVAYHGYLVARGVAPESHEYFQALDAEAARLGGSQPSQPEPRPMSQPRPPASSTGAPPSRGDGRGGAPTRTVTTPIGALKVSRTAGNQMHIEIPPHHRADYEEAARINRMPLTKYVAELVEIADEQAGGNDAGLRVGNGGTWR